MTNPEHKLADALRVVALRLENALEEGRRSATGRVQPMRPIGAVDKLHPPHRFQAALLLIGGFVPCQIY